MKVNIIISDADGLYEKILSNEKRFLHINADTGLSLDPVVKNLNSYLDGLERSKGLFQK